MRAFFKKEQFLMTFLVSAMLGVAGAFLLAGFGCNVFSRSFSSQIIALSSLSLLSICMFYLLLSTLADRWSRLQALLTLEANPFLVLRKLFLSLFFLFPLVLILFVQFAEMLGVPVYQKYVEATGEVMLGNGNARLLFGVTLLVWLCFIGIILVVHRRKMWETLPDALYIFVIIAFTVILRVILMLTIKTIPSSDFGLIQEDAVRIAQGISPQHMYISTHVSLIMIYGFLYRIFGTNLMVAYTFNLLCYALAGIFFYLAGRETFGSRFWGGLAGLVLVAWPALTFYSNVLTPEHVFILIESVLLYVLALFFKRLDRGEKIKWKHDLTWYLLLGFLFGLLSLFRPFSQLYLLAFIITLFVYKWASKQFLSKAVGIVLLLLIFWGMGLLPGAIANHYDNQFSRTRPCNLLVGVNFESVGIYNPEDSALCSKLQSHIPDDKEFSKAVLGLVWQRIFDGRDQLAHLIGQKMAVLWANSLQIAYWAVMDISGWNFERNILLVTKLGLIDLAMMFSVTLISLLGAVIAFFKDIKPVIFFSLLAFFGFNLMETVFEIQTRYRTVVMPLFILFFVWSLTQISAIIDRRAANNTPLT